MPHCLTEYPRDPKGNLYLCYDEHALSSDDDVLMAPRVALMANWEANLALEIILGEDR